MSDLVEDVMTKSVVSLQAHDRCEDAVAYLGFLGIHSAVVVDVEGQVCGTLSMSDLLGDLSGTNVSDRMSSPALTISANAPVAQARQMMASTGFHHLPVVDDASRPVGFLSAVDLLGDPSGPRLHPSTPSLAQCTANDLWSDDASLDRAGVDSAPSSPGYFLLSAGDDLVWAEGCHDLRKRLVALLEDPPPRVMRFVAAGPLHFRYAVVEGGPHRILGARG